MDLFIYLDCTHADPAEIETVAGPIGESIREWVLINPSNVEWVDQRCAGASPDAAPTPELPVLGIHLAVKRKAELKAPLNFLYSLAKQYKQEFVLGILDKETGATDEVCYFGYEEGKPDAFEVSNYVGL